MIVTLTNLGCGYQGIRDEHFFKVKSLYSDTVVFHLNDSIDFIEYCSCDSVSNGSLNLLFYGSRRAYKADGTIAFEYPDSSFLNTTSSRYLILSEECFHKQTGAHISKLLLKDKYSGQVVKTIEDTICSTITFVSENEQELFLKADVVNLMFRKSNSYFFLLPFLLNPQSYSTKSCILIINKSNFSIRKYTLGKKCWNDYIVSSF